MKLTSGNQKDSKVTIGSCPFHGQHVGPTPVTLNLYHQWAHIDQLLALLNENLKELSQSSGLPSRAIKVIRALALLEHIGISIEKSFLHPGHPIQVDDLTRQEWTKSFKTNVHRWREILAAYLPLEYHKKSFDNHFLDTSNLNTLTDDEHLDAIKIQYAYIEPFFRGIHQMLEVVLNIMMDECTDIIAILNSLTIKFVNGQPTIDVGEKEKIILLRKRMTVLSHLWEQSAIHILQLSKMDTGSYAEYRSALIGTSGGDSRQLRSLKETMMRLHQALPVEIYDQTLFESVLHQSSTDPLLHQVLTAIRELQMASNEFWLRHFSLVANSIGMIRGSQGLPVEKLLSFATKPMLDAESLLRVVGNVGLYYDQFPNASLVKTESGEKIIGNTIYVHVRDQYQKLRDHRKPLPLSVARLDAFELRALEPNDMNVSPYASWFSPSIGQHIHFEGHGFGLPLLFFQESLSRTAERMGELQNGYWDVIFKQRIAQFQEVLFSALSVSAETGYLATIDSDVTIIIERLISALPKNDKALVLTSDQEFIAIKRVLAAHVELNQFKVNLIPLDSSSSDLASNFCKEIQLAGADLKLLIFSQVCSNTQISLSSEELVSILNTVPSDVPVIIDATQGFFNAPIQWGEVLRNRANVYVVGSSIKHARSTSGLAFLMYPEGRGLLNHPTLTGWCAYTQGLPLDYTTDENGHLLYDERMQWMGGTPGNLFALELFINTWDAILRSGQNVQSMHQYVQSMQTYFIEQLNENPKLKNSFHIHNELRRKNNAEQSSNTLVLNVLCNQAQQIAKLASEQKIFFDARGSNKIRIGFGIQHGRGDVNRLVSVLSKLENL